MSQNSSPTVCLTFDFDAMSVWLGSFAHMKAADAAFRRVGDVVADWKAAHPLPGAAG